MIESLTNIKVPKYLILKSDGTYDIVFSEQEEQQVVNLCLSKKLNCTTYKVINNYQLFKECFYKIKEKDYAKG